MVDTDMGAHIPSKKAFGYRFVMLKLRWAWIDAVMLAFVMNKRDKTFVADCKVLLVGSSPLASRLLMKISVAMRSSIVLCSAHPRCHHSHQGPLFRNNFNAVWFSLSLHDLRSPGTICG